MKYVLDSSVGFKSLVAEPDSDKAERLREAYQNGIHELLAPDVFPVEVAHGLTRAERQRRITPAQGAILLADILNHLPKLHASLQLLPRAYQVSSQASIGVYDCLYVALAERERCDLITADQKLIQRLQPLFPFVVALSTLP